MSWVALVHREPISRGPSQTCNAKKEMVRPGLPPPAGPGVDARVCWLADGSHRAGTAKSGCTILNCERGESIRRFLSMRNRDP